MTTFTHTTTTNKIGILHGLYELGVLVEHLGKTKPDDEPFPLELVLDYMGPEAFLVQLPAGYDKELWPYLFWCAGLVSNLPADDALLDFRFVADNYVKGIVSENEFQQAYNKSDAELSKLIAIRNSNHLHKHYLNKKTQVEIASILFPHDYPLFNKSSKFTAGVVAYQVTNCARILASKIGVVHGFDFDREKKIKDRATRMLREIFKLDKSRTSKETA
jgi:hypothetical protein